MARFLWTAKDQHNHTRQGMDMAPNGCLLRLMLGQQKLQLRGCYRLWPWHLKYTLPEVKQRLYLLAQWQRMLAAQLPLLDVVRLCVPADANGHVRWQLWQLQGQLQQGQTFAQALLEVKLLTPVEGALLAAAEEGGYVDAMLARLAAQERARQGVLKQLRRSLLMPTITLVVGLLVAVLLLLWLVPSMASLLATQGGELPALTSALIKLSSWLQQWGQLLLFCLVLLLAVVWRALQSAKLAARLYSAAAYLPIIGHFLFLQQQRQLYHLLSTGMQGGVTLLRCLDLFLPTCQLSRFRTRVVTIRSLLLAGQSLPEAFAQAGLPEQQVLMLNIAQRSGQLSDVCDQIAQDLDEQISERLQYLQSLVEPAITLVLTIMVGGLVLAIYLPLLQLGTMLR